MLIIQIYRSIMYHLHRQVLHKLIWIRFKEIEERLNIHLLLKLAFTLICSIRIMQALLFIIDVVYPNSSLSIDAAVRYWIPYIAMNLMFTALSLLLYYWSELGLVNLESIGKHRIIPYRFTLFFVAVNAVFHIATIVLLGVLIKPSIQASNINGDPSTKLFQTIYFFGINLPMLVLAVLGIVFINYVMKRLAVKLNVTPENSLPISRAYKKIGTFTLVVIISFALRIALNAADIWISFSNVQIQATIEFFWHSLPEVILSYALLRLTWIRKSFVKAEGYSLLSTELVAPELSEVDNSVDFPNMT